MKIRFIIILAFLATGCIKNGVHSTPIPSTNFSLIFSREIHVHRLATDAPNYSHGMRASVSSHTAEEYIALARDGKTSEYFSFYVYEASDSGDRATWMAEVCPNESAEVMREFVKEKFIVVQMEACAAQATFGVYDQEKWYTLKASPDTHNLDVIWEALKTIGDTSKSFTVYRLQNL